MDRSDLGASAFIDRLRTIAGCLTDRPVLGTGLRPADRFYHAGIAPLQEPVLLRSESGNLRLNLQIKIDYLVAQRIDNPRESVVRVAAYSYSIADRDDREIVAWHLHALDRSAVTHPHLHVSSLIQPIPLGRGLEPLPLADLHIPTGYVDLADIVRFLIAEVGVRPRRREWEAILTASA